MISDLFKKDYRQMTAQGVKFTPEDIIRLNALAVRARLAMNSAGTLALPRAAFLPKRRSGVLAAFFEREIVLREPTIAHEMWIEQAQRYITVDSERTFDLLYGYALSRPAEKLPDAFDPERLIRKVFTWCARHLAHLTREQLSSAVDYCLFGADWTAGERGPRSKVKGQTEDGIVPSSDLGPLTSDLHSPTIGLLVRARAIRLPISLDDAKRMTASELQEAIDRALSDDGKIDWEKTRIAALKPYVLARNEIRRRSAKAATEASPERRQTQPSNGSSSGEEAQ